MDNAETFAEEWAQGYGQQGQVNFDATGQVRGKFADMLPKLREAGISLREAVEFALSRLWPAGGDKTLAEVVEELRDSKKSMAERGTLREHSERAFRLRSQKIVDAFGDTLCRELTLDEAKA